MPGQVIDNENIEKLIRELVAIKDFDRVKEERDDAREKLGQLETKTSDYEEIKRQREEAASRLTSDTMTKSYKIRICPR